MGLINQVVHLLTVPLTVDAKKATFSGSFEKKLVVAADCQRESELTVQNQKKCDRSSQRMEKPELSNKSLCRTDARVSQFLGDVDA